MAGVVVGALAGAGVVLPTVALPVAEAHAVPPDVETLPVRDVDRDARSAPGALTEAHGHAEAGSGSTGTAEGELAALNEPTTTDPFLVAGVTWDADSTVEVLEVALRVREDGSWTDWQVLGIDGDGGDGDPGAGVEGARAGTEPFMSTGADGVQLRVRTADGRVPGGLDVDLVDPGTSPADANIGADTGPAASAGAATGLEIRPPIRTRADWGADESLAGAWPEVSSDLKAVYVHHTAGTNSYTETQSAALVRGIYAYHTKSRGWPDIGYQFLVDKFGNKFQGRKSANVDNPIGAQAGGFNTGTIGVSAMGNYETARPTRATLQGLAGIIAWKTYQYEVNVSGSTTLTSGGGGTARWPAGTRVSVRTVLPHQRTNQTACPGRYLLAELDDLRAEVRQRKLAALKRYGDVSPVVAAPARAALTSSQYPVQWEKKSTYRWKPVKGARYYQVLYRESGWRSDMPQPLYWRVLKSKTTATSITTTMSAGRARQLAVRAVGPKYLRGPITVLARNERPVDPGQWTRSSGWTKKWYGGYWHDYTYQTAKGGATIKLTGAREVRRVVIRGATNPADGKLRVLVDGKAYATLDFGRAADPDRVFQVTLPSRVDGTVTLQKVSDGKKIRVSAVALHRW